MSTPQDQPDFCIPSLGPISKESRLSWLSTLSNYGTNPTMITLVGSDRLGKFFPRGCRGFITTIEVYCDCMGGAAGNITVYISPEPHMSPIDSQVIAVPSPAAAAWRSGTFNTFWNYDSLFIWIYTEGALRRVGYDTGKPYDDVFTSDDGSHWQAHDSRLWIKVNYRLETAGDVPVSGTLTTVSLPCVATDTISNLTNIPSGFVTWVVWDYGVGTVLQITAIFDTVVAPAAGVLYEVRIYCDDLTSYTVNNRDITQSVVAVSGRSSHGEFYQTTTQTIMNFRIPLQFRKWIEIYCLQTTGANVNTEVRIYDNKLV